MDKKVVFYLLLGLFIGLFVGMFLWFHPSQERYACQVQKTNFGEPEMSVKPYYFGGEELYIVISLKKWHSFSPVTLRVVDEYYREAVYNKEIYVDGSGYAHITIKVRVRELSEKYTVIAYGYTSDCNNDWVRESFTIKK